MIKWVRVRRSNGSRKDQKMFPEFGDYRYPVSVKKIYTVYIYELKGVFNEERDVYFTSRQH